ncbi:helix-turn-helix domain-containing protein [Rhodococcoides kyotonense]|uniref:AraC-type DNA-binding protein n=1 Tax=Rhodococcoides kyotonense TaxID=398843 RepID=A0A239MWC1_9NOCA|nr:helix-turn-helix domain-containing protein [Rhodococcus kyotonensis]SNT46800.1 AraC-type DNA-binding protein [Rhodococcus kyotonensis]
MARNRMFDADAVPAIPPARTDFVTNSREPLLFWVRSGAAVVDVGGGSFALRSGEALWVPAGFRYRLDAEAGAVAFPIFVPVADTPDGSGDVVRVPITTEWEDWLVHRFARSLGYLRGAAVESDGFVELIAGARPLATSVGVPPMPVSPEAVTVARGLLRSPDNDDDLAALARSLHIGCRTLQRQFVDETGMPFTRWRTAVRIAAAATYLDAGRGIGWVGHRVGFTTAGGFTRAFRRHTGSNPSDFLRTRHELSAGSAGPYESVSTTTVPIVPASETWARVNDFHVFVWVYRGCASVTVGGRTVRLERGDALLLPAGMRNCVRTTPGLLLLPLGSSPVRDSARSWFDDVVHFPIEAENYLMHTVVANYSLLRPVMHDGHRLFDLALREFCSLAVEFDDAVHVVNAVVAAVRGNPADARTLAEWAHEAGIDSKVLNECFTTTIGQSFPRWRSHVRMTLARRYLGDGLAAGEVARTLGYKQSSGFTKVFTDIHGMTPSTYRRDGWRESREELVVA